MELATQQATPTYAINVHLLRTDEYPLANSILQHPDVASLTLVDGVDVTQLQVEAFIDLGALAVVGTFDGEVGAVWLFLPRGEGVYDGHTNILPKYRGKHGLDASKACTHFLFTQTNCTCIVTMCPANNPATSVYARKLGFYPAYKVPKAFVQGGIAHDVEVHYLTFVGWALSCGDIYANLGERFHSQLEKPTHADDANHDACVGVCLEVGRYNPSKGCWLYNQLAPLYGYLPIRLLHVHYDWSLLYVGDQLIRLTRDVQVQTLHVEQLCQ